MGEYRRSVKPPEMVFLDAIALEKIPLASHHRNCRALRPVRAATSRELYEDFRRTEEGRLTEHQPWGAMGGRGDNYFFFGIGNGGPSASS